MPLVQTLSAVRMALGNDIDYRKEARARGKNSRKPIIWGMGMSHVNHGLVSRGEWARQRADDDENPISFPPLLDGFRPLPVILTSFSQNFVSSKETIVGWRF